MNRRSTRPNPVVLAAVAFLATAAWAPSARAQFSAPAVVTVQGSVTSDQPTETSTADIDTQTQSIARSVTTITTGGQYAPNSQFISSLDQVLLSGVNPQNTAQLMPVTQGLPCDSQAVMLSVASATAKTYQAALANTQQQLSELQGEDFSVISANIQSPAVLSTLQGIGQGILAMAQEQQLTRQQLAILTTVIATDRLQALDAIVRSRLPRNCE